MLERRRLITFSIGTALLLSVGYMWLKCRGFFYAEAWHSTHGTEARVEEYSIAVPQLWWQDRVPIYKSSRLLRASIESSSEILETPLPPDSVSMTDEEELKAAQDQVLHEPGVRLVELRAPAGTLYCTDNRKNGLSLMHCEGSKIPYVFLYVGPSTYEAEAEAILRTLH